MNIKEELTTFQLFDLNKSFDGFNETLSKFKFDRIIEKELNVNLNYHGYSSLYLSVFKKFM